MLGCGDSGGASSTGETTNQTTTAPSSSEPSTTEQPTGTSAATSSGDPTGSGTVGQTDTGADSSSGGSSGPATASGTSGTSSGGTSSGDGSSGGEGSSSTGDTGAEATPCVTDKDCVLADGCCECEPLGPGETPIECDIECIQTVCSSYGLDGAAVECRFGRCTFAKVECNPLGVVCKKLKPECPAGQVASVVDDGNGKCWTGYCVPAEACDWVPDCAYCEEDELVCVGKLQKGAYHVCEPRPFDCGEPPGDIDCACGQQICDQSPPHTVCHDEAPDIACECPFC